MFTQIFSRRWWNYYLLALVSFLAHWNIFFYPAYREDEGTYIAQAWAVVNNGSLAPYTYWYDHSPMGWFAIAFWNIVSSPFIALLDITNSVEAGRIFIVLLNMGSALILYNICKKLTQSQPISFLAALLFILTPLSVEFGRRVFIDNIMVFWLLLSIFFSIRSMKLKNIVLSAITFAIAVLSKESAIVFLPVIITSVYLNAHKNNRPFVTMAWVTFSIFMISLYPLYALIKGEFFVYGELFGGDVPHVSLLESLQFQAGRSQGFFWESTSAFRRNLEGAWLQTDFLYILLGVVVAPLVNFLFFRKYKWTGFVSMLVIVYVVYLMRGQVLDWYVIPLIPLAAINIAVLLRHLQIAAKKYIPKLEKSLSGATAVLLVAVIGFGVSQNVDAYRYNQTENQRRATDWIKSYVFDETTLLIDNYAFHDLNPRVDNIEDINIHYYYKADPNTDPQIAGKILKNDWRNVDYVMLTPAVETTLEIEDFQLVEQAVDNSDLVIRYNEFAVEGDAQANYPVEIREVNNFDYRLSQTWDYYKQEFISPEGQVIDPNPAVTANTPQVVEGSPIVTSEGQAYALMRAVWQDDQKTFDTVLDWTNENLRKENGLYAWQAPVEANEELDILAQDNATDADIDLAFALLQAGQTWQEESYTVQGQELLSAIWERNVIELAGNLYVLASDNAERETGYLTNASYYSPAMFRSFALVDENPSHDWNRLADDSYKFLRSARSAETGLVSNWNLLGEDGTVSSASQYVAEGADLYGYDAFRTYYRVALDRLWFDSADATEFLNYARDSFFLPYWNENYSFATLYRLDGEVVEDYDDISTSAGPVSVFFADPGSLDTEVYLNTLKYAETATHWAEADNYYDQNWGWFTTALYGEELPNYLLPTDEEIETEESAESNDRTPDDSVTPEDPA